MNVCYLKLGLYVNYELQQNMNFVGMHSNTYHSPSDSKQQQINHIHIYFTKFTIFNNNIIHPLILNNNKFTMFIYFTIFNSKWKSHIIHYHLQLAIHPHTFKHMKENDIYNIESGRVYEINNNETILQTMADK